jgi:DNA polymerase-3 subunit epsilon
MYSGTRTSAVQRAREYLAARPVYLDTETTGLGGFDEIVEVCILDHDGRALVDTLVRPSRPIPADVVRIHGITNAIVKTAPTWPEVWPEVQAALQGRLVGIYNADFDLRMMAQSHRRYSMGWASQESRAFCIMRLYADFYGRGRWQTLDDAGRQCSISLPNAHRARADTLLARAVLLHIAGQAG